MNLSKFISVYMLGIPLFILLLLLMYFLTDRLNSKFWMFFIAVLAGNYIFYLMIQFLAKHFNYRLYLPVDDIDEHMKKLPSYLK